VLREIALKAKAALSKPAKYGVDVDLTTYNFKIPPRQLIGSLNELPDDVKRSAPSVGLEITEAGRSGSYFQIDASPVYVKSRVPGLTVMPLSEAINDRSFIDNYYWKAVDVDLDKFTAAAELYGGKEGYVIIAGRNVVVENPVQACLYMSEPRALQAPHNIIVAEEGSTLYVVTGCATRPRIAGLHAGVSEFYVKRNATVVFIMIHNWSRHTHVRPRTGVVVEDGGTFISYYVNMGFTKSLQTFPNVYLRGAGAKAVLHTVILGLGSSKIDVGGFIALEAEGTSGEISSRVVAKDEVEVVARGKIGGYARGGRGHVECSGLLLSKHSSIRAIPELEAKVKDVQLTHEAAIGKLAEEEVFYIQARGFTREEAVSMLIRGFLKVRMEGLPPILEKYVNYVTELTASKL